MTNFVSLSGGKYTDTLAASSYRHNEVLAVAAAMGNPEGIANDKQRRTKPC